MEPLRKCLKCGLVANTEVDLVLFAQVPKGRTAKYGKLNRCKKCHNAYMKAARDKVPKEILRERRRKRMLKEKYNISVEDYDSMLAKQDTRCVICGKHQKDDKKTFCVDHNHSTGEIRGLLCNNCNSALGKFNDDLKTLINAAFYLVDNGSYGGGRLSNELYFKIGELKALIELS